MNTVARRMQMPKHRLIFLVQGTVAILAGVMFIGERGQTIRSGIIYLGVYWLVISLLTLTRIFVDRSGPWFLALFIVIFSALAGIFALRHPVLATSTVPTILVIILGLQGLIMGGLDTINAFQGGGRESFVLGGANVLIGLLLAGAPFVALAIPSLVFGILLLIQGGAFVIWAFRVHRLP